MGRLYALRLYNLQSKNKKIYIGKTDDLKERISRHNSGKSVFTKNGAPWTLVHYQAFAEKEDANREELFLKTGKGRERRNYLLKNFINKIKNHWRGG